MCPAQQRSSSKSSSGPLVRCRPDGTPEASNFSSALPCKEMLSYNHPLVPKLQSHLDLEDIPRLNLLHPLPGNLLQLSICSMHHTDVSEMVQCIFCCTATHKQHPYVLHACLLPLSHVPMPQLSDKQQQQQQQQQHPSAQHMQDSTLQH